MTFLESLSVREHIRDLRRLCQLKEKFSAIALDVDDTMTYLWNWTLITSTLVF